MRNRKVIQVDLASGGWLDVDAWEMRTDAAGSLLLLGGEVHGIGTVHTVFAPGRWLRAAIAVRAVPVAAVGEDPPR